MKVNLRLSQKAMLLIAVPLLFEFFFVTFLVLQLKELENEYARESLSRDVLMSVNLELNCLLQAAAAMGMYQLNRDDHKYIDQFNKTIDKLKVNRAQLNDLVKEDQGEDLKVFNSVLDSVMTTLDQCKFLSQGGDKIDSMRAVMRVRKLLKEMDQVGTTVIDRQNRIHEDQRSLQGNVRQTIKMIIMLGVAMSVVIALLLVRYFNIGTSRRLSTLMNNTLKLAMEQPLEPPLQGNDEIATIDGVFHKMADTLSEARRKEQALTQNALDVICSLDEKGRFTKMNQAVKSLWGYENDDLLGRSIMSLVEERQADRTRLAIEEVISGKSTETLEITMRRKDQTMCDMLWSAQWSPSERSLFCVARDISERKRLERMKQEVVAMVSHDLRSPLTAIQAMFELLESGRLGELTDSGRSKIQRGNSVLNRLISMINDLLDMERLESGMFELNCSTVPFKLIVGQTIEAVQGSADAKNIKLTTEGKDIELWCDGDRIVRVLVNFVSNAIKFSAPDSSINIEAQESGDTIEVSVVDRGRGIPADKVESVFDRFKQVDRSDETVKGGSGLGLAICKAIIDAHKGSIGVQSELDKGSKFWFKLPRK